MTTYYIDASERSYVTDPGEMSDEPYSYRGASDISVFVRGVSRSKPENAYWGFETIESEEDIPAGSPAFFVWVHYTDGDTFGSSGYWKPWALTADSERALEIKAAAEKPHNGQYDDYSNFRPWDGYFASLTEVHIETLLVGP